ncbi:MAG: hypothetical protein IIC08_04215 [Proteobacteria bacterium]|nr:hypothetical protein [Pseudomonadota bacterium]
MPIKIIPAAALTRFSTTPLAMLTIEAQRILGVLTDRISVTVEIEDLDEPHEVAIQESVPVTMASYADLMAFAHEIAGNPEAVRSGKATYRLARNQTKPATAGGGFRWPGGVLNEVRIIEISKTHSRVLLGPGAVVTPLARDKARQVKLELVKERS